MEDSLVDVRRDLETIRSLMEKARHYRHLPASAAFTAGLLAAAGAGATHALLSEAPIDQAAARLGIVWGSVLAAALGATAFLWQRKLRRVGAAAWSPLAADLLHTLWPSCLVGVALTAALARAGSPELVPAVWMLTYGAAGIAAGNYTRPAIRGIGLSFLASGLADLVFEIPPAIALGVSFGLFHFALGAVLLTRPEWE